MRWQGYNRTGFLNGAAITPKVVANTEKSVLDKVAYAVAMAETKNCTEGYGKTYNNCFGIKNGNTAPCTKIGRSRMCIYEKPEDSYEAFKKIWGKWYGGGLPTRQGAVKWTGGDRVDTWIYNVNHYYNKQ